MESLDEAEAAKEYWGLTEFMQKEYDQYPPFYAFAIRRVVSFLKVKSVFEFGCNAGRNLHFLSELDSRPLKLAGIDINRQSIEYGKAKWDLDIQVADETFFTHEIALQPDLLFTVSVLDHIPNIRGVLESISKFTKNYLLTIEPYPEKSLAYLESLKAEGRVRERVLTETPYSYTHQLDQLLPELSFERLVSMPLPTYRNNWGPLYRLDLWSKSQCNPITPEQANLLKETLIFECMLRNVELSELLRKTERERRQFSQKAYQLKRLLSRP